MASGWRQTSELMTNKITNAELLISTGNDTSGQYNQAELVFDRDAWHAIIININIYQYVYQYIYIINLWSTW